MTKNIYGQVDEARSKIGTEVVIADVDRNRKKTPRHRLVQIWLNDVETESDPEALRRLKGELERAVNAFLAWYEHRENNPPETVAQPADAEPVAAAPPSVPPRRPRAPAEPKPAGPRRSLKPAPPAGMVPRAIERDM